MSRDFSKGDLPAFVLAVLSEGPSHGYAIAREIESRSGELFRVREGALYPALRLLEQDGFIAGEWQTRDGGPARKTYSLTESGQAEYQKRSGELRKYAEVIQSMLWNPAKSEAT